MEANEVSDFNFSSVLCLTKFYGVDNCELETGSRNLDTNDSLNNDDSVDKC